MGEGVSTHHRDIHIPWISYTPWKGPGTRDTHPPCGQADTCENITFPQQLLQEVIKTFLGYIMFLHVMAHANGSLPENPDHQKQVKKINQ